MAEHLETKIWVAGGALLTRSNLGWKVYPMGSTAAPARANRQGRGFLHVGDLYGEICILTKFNIVSVICDRFSTKPGTDR